MARTSHRYRPTESQYKGGATENYVTYDLEQRVRSGDTATYPKAKRVYIAGDGTDWQVGDFEKRSGRKAHGVRIEYEQTRGGFERSGYTAHRGDTEYEVKPSRVPETRQRFMKIVDVPDRARNVQFQGEQLPDPYREALQDVR